MEKATISWIIPHMHRNIGIFNLKPKDLFEEVRVWGWRGSAILSSCLYWFSVLCFHQSLMVFQLLLPRSTLPGASSLLAPVEYLGGKQQWDCYFYNAITVQDMVQVKQQGLREKTDAFFWLACNRNVSSQWKFCKLGSCAWRSWFLMHR